MIFVDIIALSIIGGFLASYLIGGTRLGWLIDLVCGFGAYILFVLLARVIPVSTVYETIALITVLAILIQLIIARVRR